MISYQDNESDRNDEAQVEIVFCGEPTIILVPIAGRIETGGRGDDNQRDAVTNEIEMKLSM